jgi:hypothetical protein
MLMQTPKEILLNKAASRQFMFIDKNESLYPHMMEQKMEDPRIFRNETMAQSASYFAPELPKPPSPLVVSEMESSGTITGMK